MDVVERLNTEWDQLSTLFYGDELPGFPEVRWMRLHELALMVPIYDHLGIQLVIAAQQGNATAGRVMLQAILPRLTSVSRRHQVPIDDLVTAGWMRIMTHPHDRINALVQNLALDALKSVTRDAGRSRRDLPMPTVPEAWHRDGGHWVSAEEVLALAGSLHLVPDESIEVMRSVYVDGLSGKEAAERHDTSHDMVRYRCSTATQRLRKARPTLLRAL